MLSACFVFLIESVGNPKFFAFSTLSPTSASSDWEQPLPRITILCVPLLEKTFALASKFSATLCLILAHP